VKTIKVDYEKKGSATVARERLVYGAGEPAAVHAASLAALSIDPYQSVNNAAL